MPDNRETTEIIERVAKAIYDAHVSRQPRPEDWDRWRELIAGGHQGRNRVEDTRALARAAIEAMRTPTDAMLIAGGTMNCLSDFPAPEVAWPDMIDAALGIVR
jgi:hypothetical protein